MRIRREAKENFTWVHNTFIRDKRLALDDIVNTTLHIFFKIYKSAENLHSHGA
jgi:hypothetical protein